MKRFKKIMALVITMALCLALVLPVLAEQGDAITATTGTITIENAAIN